MMDRDKLGDLTLRLVAQPRDVNFNGHAFGGWILSQMDIAAGIVALKRSAGPVATVAVEAMKFHKPVFIGDHISIYTKLVKVGQTSMTIDISIIAERHSTEDIGGEVLVTEGRFIYVAIDEDMQLRSVD